MGIALFVLLQAVAGPPCCEITGAVEDPAALGVPGALVIVRGNGEPRQTTSSENGSFRFAEIPAGRYEIEVQAPGFHPERRGLTVRRAAVRVRMRLRVAGIRTEVQVDGGAEPSADPSANRDAILLDREVLENLPVMDRDLLSAAAGFLDPATEAFGGATIVVDGIETSDTRLPASAIQEVRVNRSPYSAEYSRPGSARIEVVTRQAAPEFHGGLELLMRDHRLDARNAFALNRPEQQRRSYEADLTGPIGRSRKNTFSADVERDEDDEQSIVYAQTPEALVRGNFPRPERETEWSVRLNRYHNQSHVFSLRYAGEREAASGLGIGGFSLPETGYDETERSGRFHFHHRWFASPRWFTELSVRYGRRVDRVRSARPEAPHIVVRDAFTAGGAQRHEDMERSGIELAWLASAAIGSHSLRAGFLVPELDNYAIDDRTEFGGAYTFASLADYLAGRPTAFARGMGQSRLQFRTWNVAAFIQDDIQVRPGMTLAAGLRYDRQSVLPDSNNLAPRLSLAWGLGDKRRTVLRAGAGIFYDRARSGLLADLLRFDGVRLRQVVAAAPAYPVAPDAFTALPPNIVRLSPGIRSPYLLHSSIGVERRLSSALEMALSYSRIRGVALFRSLDRNAPEPPEYARPQDSIGILREVQSSADLQSGSLNLTLRVRAGEAVRASVAYTLGRSFNNTDGAGSLPPDSTDLRNEWGRAAFDRRHRFRAVASLQGPRRFSLGVALSAGSGRPYEWTTGRDTNRDGDAAERPAGVRRNALEGPGALELDLRGSRRFRLGGSEARTLRFNLDAFNVLNRVNLTRMVGNQSSPFFGRATAAGAARRLQASIQFDF